MRFKRAIILFLIVLSISRYAIASEDAFEQYTKEYINPWLSHYNLTTEAEVQSGIVGGEGGQRIKGYAISPSNPNIHMITTDICGVYRSTDGGVSWKNKSEGLGAFNHSNIIFHPENEKIAFALGCCPESYMYRINSSGSKSGIMVTYDGGETWKLSKKLPFVSANTNLLAVSGKNANGSCQIFAATNYVGAGYESGLFRSSDNGESWKCLGYEKVKFYGVYAQAKNTLVVAFGVDSETAENVFIVSNDGGDSWADKSNILPEGFQPTSMAIHPSDSTHWLLGRGTTIVEVKNYAVTESFTPTIIDNPYYYYDSSYPVKGIAYMVFGVPNDKGEAVLYCGGDATHFNMKFSLDNGRTMKSPTFENTTASSAPGYYVKPTCPHPSEYGTTFTTDVMQNIYISRNGEEYYRKSSSGYSTYMAKAIAFSGSEIMYMGFVDKGVAVAESGYNGLFKPVKIIVNELVSYESSKSVKNMLVDPNDSGHVFFTVGTNNEGGMLAETTDGFQSSKLRNDIIVSGDTFSKISDMFRHNQKPDIIYAGRYVSFDNGVSFEKIAYPVKAMDSSDNDIVYSVSSGKLMRSDDCGKNWNDTGITCDYYRVLETDCENSDIIYTDKKCIDMSNGTVTDMIPSQYSEYEVFSFSQNPENPKHLFYCLRYLKNNGPYACIESFDGGENWHKIDGVNDMAGMTDVIFIPDTKKAYLCGSQGTFVYDYEKYENSLLYEGEVSAYTSAFTKNYIISGEAMPGEIVTLKIIDNNGTICHIAEVTAASNGSFSYKFHMEGEPDDYSVMLNNGYGVLNGVVIYYSDYLVDISEDISIAPDGDNVKITLELDNMLGNACKLTAASYKEKKLADIMQKEVQYLSGKQEYVLELDKDYDEIKLFIWDNNLVPYMSEKTLIDRGAHPINI